MKNIQSEQKGKIIVHFKMKDFADGESFRFSLAKVEVIVPEEVGLSAGDVNEMMKSLLLKVVGDVSQEGLMSPIPRNK